jgi:predicted kinase
MRILSSARTANEMQEDQDKQIANTLGCHRPHREEVALPERGSMDFQEFVPRAHAALGSGIEVIGDQDALDGIGRDGVDSQFFISPRMRV